MKEVIVFLTDGFEECEAMIVVDILRRANVKVIMTSVMGKREITSSRYIYVLADELAENMDYSKADMVVLPGGRVGTENLLKSEIVKEQCKRFAENGYVVAICAAPSILAEIGLVNGKKVTCHPDFEYRMDGAIVSKEIVVRDANIVTGKGLGQHFNLLLN